MGFGGAIFAVSAAKAVSQISEGYAAKAEANYNATLLEEKAKLIDVQKEIESGKYDRLKGQYLSKSMAVTAKQGIVPQGSALAVMLNAQTQINIDQAISNFNFAQEKNYTLAQADAQKRSGSAAVRSGYANAFSSLLSGASSYAQQKYKTNTTTFDSNTSAPKKAGG